MCFQHGREETNSNLRNLDLMIIFLRPNLNTTDTRKSYLAAPKTLHHYSSGQHPTNFAPSLLCTVYNLSFTIRLLLNLKALGELCLLLFGVRSWVLNMKYNNITVKAFYNFDRTKFSPYERKADTFLKMVSPSSCLTPGWPSFVIPFPELPHLLYPVLHTFLGWTVNGLHQEMLLAYYKQAECLFFCF